MLAFLRFFEALYILVARSSAAAASNMIHCSTAVRFKNTVAAAIARPARTTCLRGRREIKRSSSESAGACHILLRADLCIFCCVLRHTSQADGNHCYV